MKMRIHSVQISYNSLGDGKSIRFMREDGTSRAYEYSNRNVYRVIDATIDPSYWVTRFFDTSQLTTRREFVS